MPYFLQGLTMGLAYVAPIGVQNLFVINAALNQPRRRALLTALVVVFFDVSLALACFFGVGAVMEAFPAVGMVVLLVGSVIVLAIGIGLLRTKARARGGGSPAHQPGQNGLHRLCGHLVQPPGPHRRHHDAGGLSGHPSGGPVCALHRRGGAGLLPVVYGGDAGDLPLPPQVYPQGHGVDQPGLRGGDFGLWGKAPLVLPLCAVLKGVFGMQTIAIIEDDLAIGDLLEEALREEGYAVLRAYSGTEAQYLLAQHTPDLILLDLMLPGCTGEELLPALQGIPVIVVSAKVGVDDKVQALLAGAADYVSKPFALPELLARITAQLRKAHAPTPALLTCGDLTLDPTAHQVAVRGQPVKLTRTEYAICRLLLQNPGQVLAKSVILDRISQDTPDCTEGSLKQHMSNLRKKLRQAGGREYIQSVWGIGFQLTQGS